MFQGLDPSQQAGAGIGGFNPYMFGMPAMPWGYPMNSAAAFHMPGPKNEIKLFVGGLQFQTMGINIWFSLFYRE